MWNSAHSSLLRPYDGPSHIDNGSQNYDLLSRHWVTPAALVPSRKRKISMVTKLNRPLHKFSLSTEPYSGNGFAANSMVLHDTDRHHEPVLIHDPISTVHEKLLAVKPSELFPLFFHVAVTSSAYLMNTRCPSVSY